MEEIQRSFGTRTFKTELSTMFFDDCSLLDFEKPGYEFNLYFAADPEKEETFCDLSIVSIYPLACGITIEHNLSANLNTISSKTGLAELNTKKVVFKNIAMQV